MNIRFRAAAQEDFTAFYETCYFRDRDNVSLRQAVKHEWRVLLENPAALSLVAEDLARLEYRRLVGCCQMVFVSDAFVSWAKIAPTPGANVQATHPLPDGSWPLLTRLEVAEANGGIGLNALITRWARADAVLTREETMDLGRFMHDAFTTLTRGYRFREVLIDVIGEPARQQALRAGFQDRNRYEFHFQAYAAAYPHASAPHPFLMGITRGEAFATEGCIMSHYFTDIHPQFGFSVREQELLCLCIRLPEATSGTLAQELGIALHTVKNRWQSIYGRVEAADPDLLPPPSDSDSARGPEKRRRLLQYLREHPEELRPYKPPREANPHPISRPISSPISGPISA